MADEPKDRADGHIHLAFDRDFLTIPVAGIVPLKTLPDGARASRSYAQVLSSIRAIGLIEAPVVMADTKRSAASTLSVHVATFASALPSRTLRSSDTTLVSRTNIMRNRPGGTG